MLKKCNFEKLASNLLVLLPIIAITGPLYTDATVIVISLIFLFVCPFYIVREFKFTIFVLLIFFFLILISSYLNNQDKIFIFKSLLHIRFFIFSFAVYYFLRDQDCKNKLYKIIQYCIFFLVIDAALQFFTGYNIFNFEPVMDSRMSSFFGEELIMGSYILRFFLIFLALSIFFNEKRKIILILLFSIVGITLSGERASLLLMLFTMSIIIFNEFRNKNYSIISKFRTLLLVIIILILNFSIFHNIISSRLVLSFDEFSGTKENSVLLDNKYKIKNMFIISPIHHNYFLTALNMFKEKKLLGHGRGSFKNKSCDKKYQINKFSCSTHPHNTYLQLLSETGIFSFLIVFIFFLILSFQILMGIFNYKKNSNILYLNRIYLIFPIFISLFPFASTGSFYNNYLSFFCSFSLGIYLFFLKKN